MDVNFQNILSISVAVTTIGGAIITIRKIARDAEKSKKEHKADIMQSTKEEIAMVRAELESEIKAVQVDLDNLKSSVSKDLQFIKESHSSEIKHLGEKIEALREQLNSQHTQLIDFLTKLIDK